MVRFFFIRVLPLSIILAVVFFFLFGQDIVTPIGVVAGGLISVSKIRLSSISLCYLTQSGGNSRIQSLFINIFLQLLTLGVLLTAILLNVHLFYSLTAGLLLTTAVICVNAFTEKIGLTHNNWV